MFSKEFYMKPEAGRDNWTGPTPREVEAKLPEVLRIFGENSEEHGFMLLDLGDALHSEKKYTEALQSYEKAATLLNARNECTPRAAWVIDRLAYAKKSIDDLTGARTDLKRALEIWAANDGRTDSLVANIHIERRTEDLQNIERMIKFRSARPPELPTPPKSE